MTSQKYIVDVIHVDVLITRCGHNNQRIANCFVKSSLFSGHDSSKPVTQDTYKEQLCTTNPDLKRTAPSHFDIERHLTKTLDLSNHKVSMIRLTPVRWVVGRQQGSGKICPFTSNSRISSYLPSCTYLVDMWHVFSVFLPVHARVRSEQRLLT